MTTGHQGVTTVGPAIRGRGAGRGRGRWWSEGLDAEGVSAGGVHAVVSTGDSQPALKSINGPRMISYCSGSGSSGRLGSAELRWLLDVIRWRIVAVASGSMSFSCGHDAEHPPADGGMKIQRSTGENSIRGDGGGKGPCRTTPAGHQHASNHQHLPAFNWIAPSSDRRVSPSHPPASFRRKPACGTQAKAPRPVRRSSYTAPARAFADSQR